MSLQHPPGTICVASGDLSRYPAFFMSLASTQHPNGTTMQWHTGNGIAMNRNALIREMQGEWIWMIDDDHVWDGHLLMHLLDRNVDIVAPLYTMRYHPFTPSSFDEPLATGQYPAFSWETLSAHTGLFEVAATGAAGLLIRKRVIKAMSDPWFEVGKVVSDQLWEDAWFCAKARKAGFRVYTDLDVQLGHITQMTLWPAYKGVDIDIGANMRINMPHKYLVNGSS